MATTSYGTGTQKKALPIKKVIPTGSTGTSGASSISPTSPTAVTTPVNTASPVNKVMNGTALKKIPLKKVVPNATTNTGAVDTFGAASGQSTLGQTVTPGARLSTGETLTKDTVQQNELGDLNVWGQNAIAAETANAGTLAKRNDAVTKNLLAQGITDEAGIKSYLESQDGFLDATPEEQANTLRALKEQMGTQPTTDTTIPGQTREEQLNVDVEGNIMAKEAADLVTQTEKDKKFLQSQQDKMIKIQNLEGENISIERSQRLQAAEKQVADMKQRYAYLGSQGQPGTSAVQFDAVSKQIAQAEQTYAQLKQFEQNAAQMRELGIDVNAEQFEKQMSDLTYKLDQQVSRAVQDTINKFNAESGGIDTMEELNTVREKLMDSLDKSVANIALSNQTERGLILDSYKKSIEFGKEYAKNANTVNSDMSEVLGYYVNGNGSPIFGANGLPITIPPKAPMEPIFDKDSGTFITFSSGANGEIIANPQQILPSKQNARQKGDDGSFYRTGVDGNLEFANGGGVSGGVSGGYQGPTVNPVTSDKVMSTLNNFSTNAKVGTKGGQCASFVNNYLQDMGLDRLFVDPIDIRKTKTNSTVPTVGSVAVFDYGNNPNVSEAARKYGHVAIVESVNRDGSVNILESNGDTKNPETIGRRTVPANKVFGYFDPKKGLSKGSKQLTDKEFTQSNQVINSFQGNAQVKAYEDAYTQGLSLLSSLNDASGPGDTAAIFQFMKTLDPSSVVREGEFALAAKSSGVSEYIGNTFERLNKGEKLTSKQREVFGKLAKQYILDKSKIYETKYNDMVRRIEAQGIDASSILPTNLAQDMRDILIGQSVSPNDRASDANTILQGFLKNTNTSKGGGNKKTNPTISNSLSDRKKKNGL